MELIPTRNWIYDNVPNDCVVQFNDDVSHAVAIAGRRVKRIRDPREIMQIIRNAAQVAADLDIGVFCWTLSINKSMIHPEIRPFRPVMPASAHAWGILGRARDRRLDPQFIGQGDYDFTLETLLHDRILLGDARFSFICGRMSKGRGGNTGRFNHDTFMTARQTLHDKWGKHAAESKQKGFQQVDTYRSMAVRVTRQNPMAMK